MEVILKCENVTTNGKESFASFVPKVRGGSEGIGNLTVTGAKDMVVFIPGKEYSIQISEK